MITTTASSDIRAMPLLRSYTWKHGKRDVLPVQLEVQLPLRDPRHEGRVEGPLARPRVAFERAKQLDATVDQRAAKADVRRAVAPRVGHRRQVLEGRGRRRRVEVPRRVGQGKTDLFPPALARRVQR